MSTTLDSFPEANDPEQGLFQCTTCSKTYTRVDHLARHVRSHTQEKPYQCETCDKRFSRVDLLRRHASVHAATASYASKKRRRGSPDSLTPARTSKACEACAEHHLKCEDDKPCRRCRRRSIACIVVPKIAPGDVQAVASQPMQPPAEPELSVPTPNPVPHSVSSHESMAQNAYYAENPLDTALLESASNHSMPLHDHPDHIPSVQAQTADGLNNAPPEMLDILHSNLFLSTLPSGTITPNGLFGFGIETDLDLSALDLRFIDAYNAQVPFEFEGQNGRLAEQGPNIDHPNQGQQLPRGERYSSSEAPQQSFWRFVPASTDGGFAEHANLSVPHQTTIIQSPESFGDFNQRATKEKLDTPSRDKILAIILSQMRLRTNPSLSAFPSAELLDHLIQYLLAGPVLKASSWIHCASFEPKQARPELLLAMAAYGAVLTPDRSLRKLGFAIQEVIRNHLPTVFEDDNTTIRDIQLHQAYLMHLEIGLWSGSSRKMEIAESTQQPLLTMLRRRGWLKRSGYTAFTVFPEDEGSALEKRWRDWIARESTKRLVYRLSGHDAQASMSFLVSPLVSFSELDLPLPESHKLWLAESAVEWKQLYLEKHGDKSMRIPSLNECIANLDLLKSIKSSVDLELSCSAVLHALWGLVWEFRKVSLLLCGQPRIWDSRLALMSRYQEVNKILDYYRITFGAENPILLEMISMHLHMSLEELQLFLGLEGAEQSLRVHESIKDWVKSKTSRQAIWHAGQIFRVTKTLPALHLRDFYALSLFHASLTFWAYGLASRMFDRDVDPRLRAGNQSIQYLHGPIVWLDSDETAETYRYISLGIGTPCIQGLGRDLPAGLNDPTAILDVIIDTMRDGDSETLQPNSPLVDNLISIMKRLRDTKFGEQDPVASSRASIIA